LRFWNIILGDGTFREIWQYGFEKSFNLMSVSGRNNSKIIGAPPFLRVIILAPKRWFGNSHTISY
jgi:hypothetical protein